MKYAREFITSTVVGGLFIVVPVYLAALLLLKGMALARIAAKYGSRLAWVRRPSTKG